MAPPKRKPLPPDDDPGGSGDDGPAFDYVQFPADLAKLAGVERDLEARLWIQLDWLAGNSDFYAHKPGREGVISDSVAKIAAQLISLKKTREDGSGRMGEMIELVRRAAVRAAEDPPADG